jgi:hypothetical protein
MKGSRMLLMLKMALLRVNPTALITIVELLTTHVPTEEEQVVLEEKVKLEGGAMDTAVLVALKEGSRAKGEVTVRVMFEF